MSPDRVEALTGGNQMGVAFIPPDHSAISDKGELLDRWGTPYFFHALSATEVEIQSAGPDGIFWNHDDVKQELVNLKSMAIRGQGGSLIRPSGSRLAEREELSNTPTFTSGSGCM